MDNFYMNVRNQVLDFLKLLSDESDDESIKKACKDIAKDVVEAPDLRYRLNTQREINRINREDEEWEAMM